MSEMLQAALGYAAQGYRVLPLYEPTVNGCSCLDSTCDSPGKHPRTRHGVKDASADAKQIHGWWKKWPSANIGCATGAMENGEYFAVLDVDGKEGSASLASFVPREDRETPTVITGNGQHLWYRFSGTGLRNTVGKLGPGLDVRVEGGYVVVPPSMHRSGRPYAWEETYGLNEIDLKPFPPTLIEKNTTKPLTAVEMSIINEGSRNATLFLLACALQRDGLSDSAIEIALKHENSTRCSPPLGVREVEQIVKSARRYNVSNTGESFQLFDGVNGVDVTDLLSCKYTEPEYLIRNLIPKVGTILWSGDTGSGKSSFMVHSSLAVAMGVPVAGRFATNAKGPVLYFNCEMDPVTLGRFVRANLQGFGAACMPEAGRIFFPGPGGGCDFFVPKGAGREEALLQFECLIESKRPSLVVLDTLRAIFECDENSAAEVRLILGHLHRIAIKYQCAIVLLHHLRKLSTASNSPRERVSGSRDLIAGVDVHIAVCSPSGRPMNAIVLDKTRMPVDGIGPQTKWPIEATWVDGSPPRATFAAGEPNGVSLTSQAQAEQELLSLLEAEGPKTIKQLQADGGTRKRALEKLRSDGQVLECGKNGRALLLGLPTCA